MLKKVLFVAAVMMMMVVGCAGSVIGNIDHDFDREFETEFTEALNLPEELTVTKRVNGDTVRSERINTMDDRHDFDFEGDENIDIDSIQNFDFSLEDGITFELNGTNHDGEAVTISADLTQGRDSTVNIDITD